MLIFGPERREESDWRGREDWTESNTERGGGERREDHSDWRDHRVSHQRDTDTFFIFMIFMTRCRCDRVLES